MIVNLKNKHEINDLMQSAIANFCSQNLRWDDFALCIDNIHTAMLSNHTVDLRFDTSAGLDVKTGKIIEASIDYPSAAGKNCKLSIVFQGRDDSTPTSYDFSFLPEKMEVNTMSNPNSHFKFYIKNAEGTVLVGIIVYFNR